MTTHISTDNSGKILTSTLWNQSGKVVAQVNGANYTFNTRYNEYAPCYQANTRSVTGCTNTADSQIIYYWLGKGYADELTFTVNDTDKFTVKWDGDSFSVTLGTADARYQLLTVDQINELLQLKDIVPVNGAAYNGGEDLARFIAILNLYCGIKNSSSYGDSTGTSSLSSSQYYTGAFAKAFQAAGFDSYYRIGVLSGTMAKKLYNASSYTFTELGHSILQENLDYGEIIRIGIPGHAIYMDGYRIVNGEYQYHLNYGWGNSSATKWYTIDQLAAIKIDDIGIDISPDTNVVVSNARSEYFGGSFLRGMERVNHIQTTRTGDDYVEFIFAESIAGSTINLSETANITSKSDVWFGNINVTLASDAQVVFQSAYNMSFDLNSGSILAYAVGSVDTVIMVNSNSVLTVDMDASYIYCGDYNGSIAVLQQNMQVGIDTGYVFGDFSTGFIATVNGYSMVSGSGNDTVTLVNNSAILGELDLGGGTNTITIENGSLIYGGITAGSGTLTVNMLISGAANGSMIVMDEANDDSAFFNAVNGVLNVTVTQGINAMTTYSLLECYSADWNNSYVVNVTANDFEFTLNSEQQTSNIFSLIYDNGALQLGIDGTAPEVLAINASTKTLTNKNVILTAVFSDTAMKKLYSYDGNIWYDYQDNGVVVESNMTVYFKSENVLGFASEIAEYTVSNIDKTLPDLEITSNLTELTNQDVVLTAASDKNGIIAFFDGEKWITGDTITVTQNGTYTFRITDTLGNVVEKSITVNNIDKVAPETPAYTANITTLTNQDVIITANYSEDSTVTQYRVGETGEWQNYSEAFTVTDNATIYFRAEDAAGNESTSQIVIDYIDKVAPTLEIAGNAPTPTNQDVVLSATASDGTIQYFDGTAWVAVDTITATENGTYTFRVTDLAGNVTEKSVTVDKIDKIVPHSPAAGADITKLTNANVTVRAVYSEDTALKEYSFDGNSWFEYTSGVVFDRNGTVYFRGQDAAGNYSEVTEFTVDNIDHVTDSGSTEYIFISSKYNSKTTGKTQDGTLLEYGVNAFASLEAAGDVTGKTVIFIDSKSSGDYFNATTITGTAVLPTITETLTSYNYKVTAAPKGTLNISADAGATEFTHFATINLTAAQASRLIGGNEKRTNSISQTDKSGKVQKTISDVNELAAAGTVTLKNNAAADVIQNYSKVTLTDSTAVEITNFTSKDSKSDTVTFDNNKNTITRKVTLNHTEATAGTLNATDSTLGDVTGFDTVTLNNVSESGNFRRVDANGNLYSTVKATLDIKTNKNSSVTGTYNKTETFTRGGKFTATGSVVGDIENFSTVTLDSTVAGSISNFEQSKLVTKGTALWDNVSGYGIPEDYDLNLDAFELTTTTAGSLNGSVTLKNGAHAETIVNFQSITMTDSEIGTINNVSKVTVNKGNSVIGSFTGTAGKDTLTVSKGAVLTIGTINLDKTMDKLTNNGTIILSDKIDLAALPVSGKGEFAADATVCALFDTDVENILNLGDTAENFRGTAYESSDDTWKKAVSWDGKSEYNGWLGGWDGYTNGSDSVDNIKFKATAGAEITVSGDVEWILLDKKGNEIGKEITAAGDYIIKIENDDSKSLAYSITLA